MPASVVATVWLTRDGASDLILTAAPYDLQRQREPLEGDALHDVAYVGSPFVDGEVPVHARKRNQSGRLQVRVEAADQAALEAAVDDLTDALDQFSFELHRELDGSERAWRCHAADYSATYQEAGFFALSAMVTATFPVYPIRLEVE